MQRGEDRAPDEIGFAVCARFFEHEDSIFLSAGSRLKLHMRVAKMGKKTGKKIEDIESRSSRKEIVKQNSLSQSKVGI